MFFAVGSFISEVSNEERQEFVDENSKSCESGIKRTNKDLGTLGEKGSLIERQNMYKCRSLNDPGKISVAKEWRVSRA